MLYFAAVNSSPPSLIAPAQKNLDHTPKNVHTFKKSHQMGSDFFSQLAFGDKTSNNTKPFLLAQMLLHVVSIHEHILLTAFADNRGLELTHTEEVFVSGIFILIGFLRLPLAAMCEYNTRRNHKQ